jgi:hypothetical protein
MAYVTPPTFATDDILSATDLNKLSTNQEYFKGLLDVPNTGTVMGSGNYYFRHTHDYFHWWFKWLSADVTRVRINIYDEDGNLQFGDSLIDDTSTPGSEAASLALDPSYQDSYDVSALTLGNWYRAEVTISVSGGECALMYLEERTTA